MPKIYHCKRNHKEKCYHWEVGKEESILKFQEKLEEDMNEYFRRVRAMLDDVPKRTKIKFKSNAVDKHTNVYSIGYLSSGNSDDDMDALLFFSSLLTDEVKVHNMPIN
jgi:hypothetical protein